MSGESNEPHRHNVPRLRKEGDRWYMYYGANSVVQIWASMYPNEEQIRNAFKEVIEQHNTWHRQLKWQVEFLDFLWHEHINRPQEEPAREEPEEYEGVMRAIREFNIMGGTQDG